MKTSFFFFNKKIFNPISSILEIEPNMDPFTRSIKKQNIINKIYTQYTLYNESLSDLFYLQSIAISVYLAKSSRFFFHA